MPSLDEVLSSMAPEPAVEQPDLDNYKDASEFPPPVPRGKYTLIQDGPPTDFASNAPGVLTATLQFRISGGEYDGRRVTYVRISTKVFDRDGAKVSQAADYLRAIGSTERPANVREWGAFFNSCDGKSLEAMLDWEGSCGDCYEAAKAAAGGSPGDIPRADRKKWTLTGEARFPMSTAGGRQSDGVECPNCHQPTIRAQQRVTRMIPAAR